MNTLALRPPLYFKTLYFSHIGLAIFWIFSSVLLGLGGLLREKAVGSSLFTLGLPMSRTRLAVVRAAMGIFEAITLGVLPWTLFWATSLIRGTPFSLAQAGALLALLLGCGTAGYGAGILASSLVEGAYNAAGVAYGVVMAAQFIFPNFDSLKQFEPLSLATGLGYFDQISYLPGSLPWFTISGCIAVAAAMVLASIIITVRRDF